MMEMKYGSTDVAVVFEGEYTADESPAITMYFFDEDGQFFGEQELTECIPSDSASHYGSGNAYLNSDLPKELVRWLEEKGIAEYAGHTALSGFGHYHLYHFNMEKIMEMTHALEATAVA